MKKTVVTTKGYVFHIFWCNYSIYVKGNSNKIISILKKYNIRTTCINTNNRGKILTNNKDKTDKFSKKWYILHQL